MNHFTRLGPFSLEGKESLFFYFVLREDSDPLFIGMETLEASARLVMEQFLEAVGGGAPPSHWSYDPRLPFAEVVRAAFENQRFLPAPTPSWAAEDLALLTLALLIFASDVTAEPLLSTRGVLGRFVRSAIQLARVRNEGAWTNEPLRLEENGVWAGVVMVPPSGEDLLTFHPEASWLTVLMGQTAKKNGLKWNKRPRLVVRWEAPPADVEELARMFTQTFGVNALPAPSVTRNNIRPVRPEELEFLTDALEAACALWAPGSVQQSKAGVKLSPV